MSNVTWGKRVSMLFKWEISFSGCCCSLLLFTFQAFTYLYVIYVNYWSCMWSIFLGANPRVPLTWSGSHLMPPDRQGQYLGYLCGASLNCHIQFESSQQRDNMLYNSWAAFFTEKVQTPFPGKFNHLFLYLFIDYIVFVSVLIYMEFIWCNYWLFS